MLTPKKKRGLNRRRFGEDGRVPPLALTDELHRKIVETLAAGNYVKVACGLARISRQTFYNWMERGEAAAEAEEKGMEVGKAEIPFLAFYRDVEEAVATAEATALSKMFAAGIDGNRDQWTKWMTFMERRAPQHWKRREVVETDVKSSSAPSIAEEIAMLSTDELRGMVEDLERRHPHVREEYEETMRRMRSS